MKSVLWFFAGLGAAAALAQLAAWRKRQPARPAAVLDLNSCSREQLVAIPGMDDDLAERILDNRPYRSKFDLLNRLVVPEDVYVQLRGRVWVDPEAAHKSIQIAQA